MVGNLFIRLYLLIVISIVIIGIATNWIWQNYYEDSDSTTNISQQADINSPYHQYEQLVRLVALDLDSIATSFLSNRITTINHSLSLSFSLTNIEELPADLFSETEPGTPLLLSNETTYATTSGINSQTSNIQLSLFLPLKNHNKILQFLVPDHSSWISSSSKKNNTSRNIFLAFFYGLVAITIFYWIWPLSKDLNRLQNAVKNFEKEHWAAKVDIPATSSIAHIAEAYNKLLDRIKAMIENEKTMTSSISHELRTPLARVRFALQLAKESDDSDFVKMQIVSTEDDIEEMNLLIAELLSYASLENQAFEPHFSRGDLATLISSLLARLSNNYPKVSVNFIDEIRSKKITCDENLMNRALQNLIENACKYGTGKISVVLSGDKTNYELRVGNSGQPISSELKEKIFNAFYRVPKHKKHKGFGLGLSIVRRIVKLHHGNINVGTSLLGGAEFVIRWPKKLL